MAQHHLGQLSAPLEISVQCEKKNAYSAVINFKRILFVINMYMVRFVVNITNAHRYNKNRNDQSGIYY